MTKTLGVLCVVALLGCNSDSPPGATAALDVTLPNSALTRIPNLSLIRAGDSFTLAGYDGTQVLWGRLSLDGKTLTEEAGFPLAQPLVGPVFAATTKTTPGDQLVAIVLTNSAKSAGGYDLSAIVQTVGDAAPAAPVLLDSYAAGTVPSTVQIAAGAATTGNVGFVAWGVPGMGISPKYLLLPADAATTATASKMFDDSIPANTPDWSCLATTGGRTGLGFSVVAPDPGDSATSDFDAFEVDETTGVSTYMQYQFRVRVADCQVVGSPGPAGTYLMAFETSNAIGFATYYPPPDLKNPGSVDTKNPVLSASTFGDPLNMPHPAWVAPAGGGDISIGLVRNGGPKIFRYTYYALPHGSPVTLRSEKGRTGPVASWVGPNATYVTYTDQSASGTPPLKRYFMRVESPVLP
jgi:hypothetical protein